MQKPPLPVLLSGELAVQWHPTIPDLIFPIRLCQQSNLRLRRLAEFAK
jgi:hypothetical protein